MVPKGCQFTIPHGLIGTPLKVQVYIYIWVFSEMSFPRFDRLVLSDGGPLLIQYISDARVSSRHNDKQFFLYPRTNQRRLRGALLSWRYIGT